MPNHQTLESRESITGEREEGGERERREERKGEIRIGLFGIDTHLHTNPSILQVMTSFPNLFIYAMGTKAQCRRQKGYCGLKESYKI